MWNKEQFDAVDPTETDYLLGNTEFIILSFGYVIEIHYMFIEYITSQSLHCNAEIRHQLMPLVESYLTHKNTNK